MRLVNPAWASAAGVGRRELVVDVPLHDLRRQHQAAQVVALVQPDHRAHTAAGLRGVLIAAPVRAALQGVGVAAERPEIDRPEVQRFADVGDHTAQQVGDAAAGHGARPGLGEPVIRHA